MPLNTVEELVADIRAGKMVILMDDEDRENEGDLVIAATHVRPEDINFMITHARGLVCLTLSRERCQQLNLPLMVDANGAQHATNFTLSIEAAEGITTGISAAERAHTIQTAVAAHAKPSDIVQPGHIFPLMAQPGGVLHRAGHTEAGCDLARIAGLEPASVICEIIKEDGTMARRPDLEIFAEKHGLKMGTIADLIHYRMTNEQTVERLGQESIDTEYGTFELFRYREIGNPDIHLALVKGEPKDGITTVRVHGFNPTRDLLKLNKQDGEPAWNLDRALKEIAQSDRGVLVWIGQRHLQDLGPALDSLTAPKKTKSSAALSQQYQTIGVGAQILRDLGVEKMKLLSSPLRFNALSGFNLEVVEYVTAQQTLTK
ncbi:bifunctional 3,4-dihydroxy-2-butanone-4-phosphate synthase/GTP cyclohydrolase II [Acinetobacter tandoii]|jgi:3,4-dihydroxy 2-butanone 4-phosphate synthase/GTP cyclohydrolase II|uniref:3,4-dihydroxy-2-butanone 4-phosphate synthase n=1 Tax=Acinetobacter tandoii TaxID=202954 RepID=A0A5N4W686_9GAMM|nr:MULTISPECIES: bifunctional 3,4-dihydroxy-2-butanone-4-phosphate synthase/GTP cyclohydrolase II [Acinetobacter]AUX85708.1 bifunctional 3,4-dihydroxy-2-butanone-4-phosphate synthase/GTP cyclohydrolase II [Acinetobacter sp. ACNIH2]KAB1851902.1 bifunctional 3,4-dihydroxy-2-butanone-4-phosphate synthase/GTP cyclohydrolase II [Acinetobacter tandoii]UOG17500.1 bifunctional 3,4-dihydroxy-2-butanone-4-phosphate synthase/GTP cyclohydrolase II [Acinetobacter sp. PK01]